jgi:hypothetical protein
MWMTILTIGAVVCVLVDLVLAPMVAAQGHWRRNWLAPPAVLGAGFLAGAAVYSAVRAHGAAANTMLKDDFVTWADHAMGGWFAPLMSAVAFMITAFAVTLVLRLSRRKAPSTPQPDSADQAVGGQG